MHSFASKFEVLHAIAQIVTKKYGNTGEITSKFKFLTENSQRKNIINWKRHRLVLFRLGHTAFSTNFDFVFFHK